MFADNPAVPTVAPRIIQGGMGVGVSGWRLAQAVSRRGGLGVVAGTALSIVLARRLQLGDPGGHLKRAAEKFPFPDVVERVFNSYYIFGGKASGQPFRLTAMPTQHPSDALNELTVLGNFLEVTLAKEGHDGVVGINYLEKIQLPTLSSLYGAMLAGVDFVLMGAGIPWAIPGFLDVFAEGKPASLKLDVVGALPGEEHHLEFDPARVCGGQPPRLKRPQFLAIISSATLAIALARKSTGQVNGFIVEGPTAGGHNAPPRGALQLNERGEPVYGARDVPDFEKIRALKIPFWLAGSYGTPEKIREALEMGAVGVQVGTPFAFCEESGLNPDLKRRVIDRALSEGNRMMTDPVASPTGFPFKVLELEETLSEDASYLARTRICDLGYLRHLYRKQDGTIGYRCPAEPLEDYTAKGGAAADVTGRKCVCNGLLSTMGLAQLMADGGEELALITAGDDATHLSRFLKPGQRSYSASDVMDYLDAQLR
jgi:NAD(P)H-dependent flavin oxidoreductase YrpB (nitropropane dioxygenase family)